MGGYYGQSRNIMKAIECGQLINVDNYQTCTFSHQSFFSGSASDDNYEFWGDI